MNKIFFYKLNLVIIISEIKLQVWCSNEREVTYNVAKLFFVKAYTLQFSHKMLKNLQIEIEHHYFLFHQL